MLLPITVRAQKDRCRTAMLSTSMLELPLHWGSWLDALRPNGRLLFPLTPTDGPGGMPGAGGIFLITRTLNERFDARLVCPIMIIPCAGARDEETASKLSEAFKRGDSRHVRSLRRNTPPEETYWLSHWDGVDQCQETLCSAFDQAFSPAFEFYGNAETHSRKPFVAGRALVISS